MFGGEIVHAHSTASKDEETVVLLYLEIIFYSDRQNYMDFWIRICSDYNLHPIYIYYCCFWLFVLCNYVYHMCVLYVYVYSHIMVHVRFNSRLIKSLSSL